MLSVVSFGKLTFDNSEKEIGLDTIFGKITTVIHAKWADKETMKWADAENQTWAEFEE